MTQDEACSWVGKTVQIVTVDARIKGAIGRIVFAIPADDKEWGVGIEFHFPKREVFVRSSTKFKEVDPCLTPTPPGNI